MSGDTTNRFENNWTHGRPITSNPTIRGNGWRTASLEDGRQTAFDDGTIVTESVRSLAPFATARANISTKKPLASLAVGVLGGNDRNRILPIDRLL